MVDPVFTPKSTADVSQATRIQDAPLPTAKTLARRQNLVGQFVRLLGISLKMARVVYAKHS
jgi:hypothetical protein